MSAAASSVDQPTELLKKLSLETKSKNSETAQAVKKPSGIQNGSVNAGQAPKVQMQSFERSSSPLIPGYVDPNAYFIPSGYPSTAFFFGGYDGLASEWDEYAGYLNTEGVEMPQGVYSDMYHHGYGYTPYGGYSCSGSHVPVQGQDNIMYGTHHYQYPYPYFQSQASLNAPNSSITIVSDKSNSNLVANGNNGSAPEKHSEQSSSFSSNDSYGRSALFSEQPFSGCPKFSFDGMKSLVPWYYGPASTNLNLKSPTPIISSSSASHNASSISMRYENVYDSRMNVGWGMFADGIYKPSDFGYGCYGYGYEKSDDLSELNRGPRSNHAKNLKGPAPAVTIGKNSPTFEKIDDSSSVLNREQYNRANFPGKYTDAKFFIIKSYSEDDIHKSIKYNVWASTPNGNKKLDAAYKESLDKDDGCPVFLFFSVNTSGQFVGVAEMIGPIDFNKTVDYWQQDKWIGCFNVKWHIVKDVPNCILRHITLEYNENKPVTNSRDTQEVKLEQGLLMLKIFRDHVGQTSILDDFGFYDSRQKVMLEKRARQNQHNKKVDAVKSTNPVSEKDQETANVNTSLQKPSEFVSVLKKSVITGGQSEPSKEA